MERRRAVQAPGSFQPTTLFRDVTLPDDTSKPILVEAKPLSGKWARSIDEVPI